MKSVLERNFEFIGYPNYSVDTDGNVYSKNKKMKPRKDKHGYLLINFWDGKQRKTFRVHRLVAMAFIKNVDGKTEVDHINTKRDDNRVSNLRWSSSKENKNNPISVSNRHEYNYIERLRRSHKGREVLQYTNDMKLVNRYVSTQEASRQTNCDGSGIIKCCKGKLKTVGGFIWKYAEG